MYAKLIYYFNIFPCAWEGISEMRTTQRKIYYPISLPPHLVIFFSSPHIIDQMFFFQLCNILKYNIYRRDIGKVIIEYK